MTAGSSRSKRPTRSRPAALLAAALTLACTDLTGQALKREHREFTTPDGSRFVLVQDPQLSQVHWALASWTDGRDDPPGLAGLTTATLRASLLGTWTTGSKDPEAEQRALEALDEAWQARMAAPGDAAVNRTLLQRDRAAAALCDPRAFGRVLAAMPAHRPEIVERDGVGVFALTTVAPALPQVARMVFERREQQALRGLARTWLPSVMARAEAHARHPERRVQAELLALTAPTSPTTSSTSSRSASSSSPSRSRTPRSAGPGCGSSGAATR